MACYSTRVPRRPFKILVVFNSNLFTGLYVNTHWLRNKLR